VFATNKIEVANQSLIYHIVASQGIHRVYPRHRRATVTAPPGKQLNNSSAQRYYTTSARHAKLRTDRLINTLLPRWILKKCSCSCAIAII